MKESLIDTDILSYYMRGLQEVVPRAQKYIGEFGYFIAHGDLFIAATALTHDLILVTNNTKHFSKVEGLLLENWTKL